MTFGRVTESQYLKLLSSSRGLLSMRPTIRFAIGYGSEKVIKSKSWISSEAYCDQQVCHDCSQDEKVIDSKQKSLTSYK